MTYTRSDGPDRYQRSAPAATGGSAHPDLASHDALGLATQAELDTHAATAGHTHPNLAAHDSLGLATQAELDVVSTAAALHPWLVDLDVFHTPIASVGSWTLAGLAASPYGGLSFNAANAVGDYREWNVVLGAGTWTLETIRTVQSDAGKETWTLDDGAGSYTTLGTIDDYSAATTNAAVASLTGIVLASTIRRRLRVTSSTKNASSSGQYLRLAHVQLRRTA